MINIKKLYFSYDNNNFVLNDINLDIPSGEIFGLLGPNGAGKSTLQKIMTGILKNYIGKVQVNGTILNNVKDKFYNDIGVLFEQACLYDNMSAIDNLKYFISFYDEKNRVENVEDLLLELEIDRKYWKKPIREYSKGMKRRVSIARVLSINPKILFLDEPLSGLDPKGAVLIKRILLKEKKKGTTIFISTHNLTVADQLCDRVAFMQKGKIIALGKPDDLKFKSEIYNVVLLEDGLEKSFTIDITELNKKMKLGNSFIKTIKKKETTLEDVFIEHLKE